MKGAFADAPDIVWKLMHEYYGGRGIGNESGNEPFIPFNGNALAAGAVYHGAPRCRCGSRNTTRIGESALLRQCNVCHETYAYRLKDGLLVPYALETAVALEGK